MRFRRPLARLLALALVLPLAAALSSRSAPFRPVRAGAETFPSIAIASQTVTLPVSAVSYTTTSTRPTRVFEGSFANDQAFQVEGIGVTVRLYDEPGHVLRAQSVQRTDAYILGPGESATYRITVPALSDTSAEVDPPMAVSSTSAEKRLDAAVTSTSVDADGTRHYRGTVTNTSALRVPLAGVRLSAAETVNGAFFSRAGNDASLPNVVLAPGKAASFDLVATRPTAATPVLGPVGAQGVYPTALRLTASSARPAYGVPVTFAAALSGASRVQATGAQVWGSVGAAAIDLGGYSANPSVAPTLRSLPWSDASGYATSLRTYYAGSYSAMFEGDSNLAPAVSTGVSVVPHMSVSSPRSASLVRHGRAFSAHGYLRPLRWGYTKIQAYRYERGRWVLRRTVNAKNAKYATYTRYTTSLSLPYAGRWRIRAFAPGNAYWSASYSAYHGVTAY